MRSVWSCSACALFLFSALFEQASAAHAGREWDHLHRIAKAQVTAHPVRRDEGTCPSEYTGCPATLSGGCCPSKYACATDSCYATTAGPTTACNKAGYFACAPVNGGVGCCPVGYVCGNGDACLPPAGAPASDLKCPSDHFLCPSSLNYGCCPNGMGCAANACYSTVPVTTTVVQIITTTSGSHTLTTTQVAVTVATPSPPSGLPTDDGNVAAKFVPSSVTKVAASSPTGEASGGLSGGAIGGIIAGVVILLIVVVVAAFLIIRKLRHVETIYESKHGSSSGKKTKKSQSQAQMEHYGRQLHSDMDDMSVDPLMINNPHHASSPNASGTPQPTPHTRGRADSTGFTPSPHTFPPFTDNENTNNDPRSRHASPDSNAGYFDLPDRVHNLPGNPGSSPQHQQQQQQPAMQQSASRMRSGTADSTAASSHHRGYAYHQHWRQQSNASELSADGSDPGGGVLSPLVPGGGSGVASPIPELEASGGYYAELPSQYHPGGNAGGGGGVRSRSSSNASVSRGGGGGGGGHARTRSGDSYGLAAPAGQASPTVPGLGLAPLDEEDLAAGAGNQNGHEGGATMHGYYGRRDQQAGQTAAGLGAGGGGGGGGEGQQGA